MRKEIDVEVCHMDEIFRRNFKYEVPRYQRNYSWKHDEHVEEFWVDLKNHYESKSKEPYFFGTLMLVNKSELDDLYTVIDGQQRLTTSLIMLTAFRDYFLEVGDQDEVDSLNSCLKTENEHENRMTLNVYNKDYFARDISIEEKINKKIKNIESDTTIRTKDKLLKNAYLSLAGKILEYKKGDPDQSKELGKLKEHFLRYFTIVENLIVDVQKAYRIFENINNKGLHLAQSDLVKNYLFETIDLQSTSLTDQERDNLIIEADDSWQNILRILEIMKQDENTYLRYFLTAFVKLVGKDDVFTTIKNKYKTKEQVQEFLIKLETRVSNLHQIVKPTFEDWNDETTVDYLLGLKSLGQGGMYPILLIGMEYFKSTKDLKKLMALTTKFFFRAKTVCSRNYSDIERLVNEICTKLRSDEETKIDDIKEMMCAWSQYPSNEEFELKFKSLELSDARAKYALSEIHYQMTGGREGAATKISKNAQIEHIMPQKIKGTQWEIDIKEKEGFTNNTELDEYKKINLNKLGNLTLLNNKKNIKNSNKPFLEKKLTYVDTDDIRMTKDLAILPEWDSEAIQLRQKNFISHAMKIWDLKSE